jgi:ubiquinone/menaquinone biosynthesis C-methylase UbiE
MVPNDFTSKYKIIDGIYSFIDENTLTGDNKKYNLLYNRIAWIYNLSGRIAYWLKFGGEKAFRQQFLKELRINDGDKVLETSVGTGDNFRFLNKAADYYGVDLSIGMLKQAKKHLRSWKIQSILIHCEAEKLPFPDEYFDVVFHCGGINYYNDKRKAISEMIRVAKKGTTLLIVDETEKTVREIYNKNVVTKERFSPDKANIPLELVPSEMLDIRKEIICQGYMYMLLFKKP